MILIAGAGAVGGTTVASLRRAGRDVALVDEWHQNVEAIRRDGMRLKGREEEFSVDVRALYLDELARLDRPLDVVLLAVKSYDTEWMVRALAPYLAADGYIVSLQNGVNEGRIAQMVGAERTVGCVVHMSVGMFEPGVVTRYSLPDWLTFTVGELDGSRSERLGGLAELLSPVGPVAMTGNLWGALWAKLAINAMNNGLTGVTGMSSPGLWLDPRGLSAMVRIGGEVVSVSERLGCRMEPLEPSGAAHPLPPAVLAAAADGDDQALEEVRTVFVESAQARKAVREGLSSLLQDVTKRRRTEIDYLNGEVIRRGAELGQPTPANEAVVALVKQLERGELERNPGNLERFLGATV